MVNRPWTCPTCGAEYTLGPAGQPIGTRPASPDQDEVELCSSRQANALYALGQELPRKKEELLEIIRDDYGKSSIDDLTVREASALITRLQRRTRR